MSTRCALRTFGLAAGLLLAAGGLQGADSAYSSALSSTLRVEDRRERTVGAAVCLGDGLAVTAAHVLRDHKPFRVADGGGKTDWQRTPLAVHEFYELALVKAPAGCAAAEPASPAISDEVFTLGFPENGWEQHASFGRVGSIAGRYVRTNILVVRGNSGGGLWTLDGKLVGICSGKAELGAQFIDITPAVEMAKEAASRLPGHGRLRMKH